MATIPHWIAGAFAAVPSRTPVRRRRKPSAFMPMAPHGGGRCRLDAKPGESEPVLDGGPTRGYSIRSQVGPAEKCDVGSWLRPCLCGQSARPDCCMCVSCNIATLCAAGPCGPLPRAPSVQKEKWDSRPKRKLGGGFTQFGRKPSLANARPAARSFKCVKRLLPGQLLQAKTVAGRNAENSFVLC